MKAMKLLASAVAGLLAWGSASASAQNAIAPGGTLRVVYLGNNPAQAVRNPTTGEIRGPSAELARELGRRIGVPVEIRPIAGPPQVIEEVAAGRADIGFVAYAPSRAGTVEFSQTYTFVRQTFLVLEDSPIRSVADIDRAGQKIAGTTNDSITLFLGRTLKSATLLAVESNPDEIKKRLLAKDFDAFGANRQRLTTWMKELPGTRVLPDNLFGVPQTIIVPKGKPEVLADITRFIDDARASGLIQKSIEASGLIGVEVAPAGSWTPQAP
jgi:polar amino acid transport system substrate-binding protein